MSTNYWLFSFVIASFLLNEAACQARKSTYHVKMEQSDSLFNMYEQHPKYANDTVCQGHDSAHFKKWEIDPAISYKRLRRLFGRNCTHISGNLFIRHLKPINGTDPDISFLSTIKEVSGYVMIYGNSIQQISLPNLRIIRGETFYPYREWQCSLIVMHNHDPSSNGSLRSLDLRSLRSIINYDVCFSSNMGLCYAPFTINWTDILETPESQTVHRPESKQLRITAEFCSMRFGNRKLWKTTWEAMRNFQSNQSLCPESCPSFNGRRYCWDKNPEMCQTLNKCQHTSCSGGNRRCYREKSSGQEKCCHYECAAGCHGDRDTDCEACRTYINDQRCVNHCPRAQIYDRKKYRHMASPNPDSRLAMGPMCVKKCAPGLVKYKESCIRSCDKKNHVVRDNECVPCYTGNVCPKRCFIRKIETEVFRKRPKNEEKADFTLRSVLKALENCTIVEGNIDINSISHPDRKDIYTKHFNNEKVREEDLWNLRNMREFKGKMQLTLTEYNIKNLTFLQSLRVLTNAEIIVAMSKIEYLGILNLRVFNNSKFLLLHNNDVCFVRYVRKHIRVDRKSSFGFTLTSRKHRKLHRRKCSKKKCDPSCEKYNGCAGPGPSMCFKCKEYEAGGTCVSRCENVAGFYTEKNQTSILRKCKRCHPQCRHNCTGPSPSDCIGGCSNFMDGNNCVEKCPFDKYTNMSSKQCLPCDPGCFRYFEYFIQSQNQSFAACGGPSNRPGPNGCTFCEYIMVNETNHPSSCQADCPNGTYLQLMSKKLFSSHAFGKIRGYIHHSVTKICRRCHKECLSCISGGPYSCDQCKNFRLENKCVSKCPSEEKSMKSAVGESICIPPAESKIVQESSRRMRIVVASVFVLFILFAFIILIVCCLLRQRAIAKQETIRLQAKYTGALPEEELEPLNPSHLQPNYTQLRIINERELRRGQIIGSGAFGTVYKAQWLPPKEKDERQVTIPVAIKVLTDATDQLVNKELLEEARVMASVDNRYCMRLIGVCMTAQLQLVSQFMPLGSLLEYLRKNSSSIGSKALLTWAHQIAKGMVYLESRSIIHRDLAARNVLVQDPNHVRITDFGLAKLLDINEDEYLATGGKMPVKWLALECIRQRRFTHKSDVWAYGVTLWELFTFGGRPYPELRAAQVCDFLESGERLQQPEIVTLDVYMLMIKCWMLDEDSRPNFGELADEVGRMSRDPGRYLVVKADELHSNPLMAPATDARASSEETDLRLHSPSALPDMVEEEDDANDEPETEEEDADDEATRLRLDDDDDYATHAAGGLCAPRRPLKTTGAEPVSPQVAATPQHVGTRRHGGEVNHAANFASGCSEHKYGHLEKELANKQRVPNANRRDRSRYASDPLDSPIHCPRVRCDSAEAEKEKEEACCVELPWKLREEEGDDGYLQPRMTNPAAFSSQERPQERKENTPTPSRDLAPPSPATRMQKIQSPQLAMQALNQEYFENGEGGQYYNEAAIDNSKLV